LGSNTILSQGQYRDVSVDNGAYYILCITSNTNYDSYTDTLSISNADVLSMSGDYKYTGVVSGFAVFGTVLLIKTNSTTIRITATYGNKGFVLAKINF